MREIFRLKSPQCLLEAKRSQRRDDRNEGIKQIVDAERVLLHAAHQNDVAQDRRDLRDGTKADRVEQRTPRLLTRVQNHLRNNDSICTIGNEDSSAPRGGGDIRYMLLSELSDILCKVPDESFLSGERGNACEKLLAVGTVARRLERPGQEGRDFHRIG